jgi:hypothetical protein
MNSGIMKHAYLMPSESTIPFLWKFILILLVIKCEIVLSEPGFKVEAENGSSTKMGFGADL